MRQLLALLLAALLLYALYNGILSYGYGMAALSQSGNFAAAQDDFLNLVMSVVLLASAAYGMSKLEI